VTQWTDASLAAESGVISEITSLLNIITDAITAGDANKARAEMTEHVRHAGEQLARHVDARIATQQ
jgi:DNA-binding GntR family transcriptional regulator